MARYSAAYPTGREHMLEPRYGCAEEALLRRAASPTASPKGPQGAARERGEKMDFISMGVDPMEIN